MESNTSSIKREGEVKSDSMASETKREERDDVLLQLEDERDEGFSDGSDSSSDPSSADKKPSASYEPTEGEFPKFDRYVSDVRKIMDGGEDIGLEFKRHFALAVFTSLICFISNP